MAARLPTGRKVLAEPSDPRAQIYAGPAGASHHTVLATATTAITSEVLEDFAEMTRTEMVLIDAGSTPRSVQRELRWNAAYHRLAQGL